MDFIEVTPEQGLKVAEVLLQTGSPYQGNRLRKVCLETQAGINRKKVTLSGREEREAWMFLGNKV